MSAAERLPGPSARSSIVRAVDGVSKQDAGQRDSEFRDLAEHAAISVHWVGPDGTILWANQAELEFLGYAPDEYIGHHIGEFHVDADTIADILRRLHAGETLRQYEARLRHRDGSIRHVLISSNVRRENGEFIHTRCFTVDNTEPKRALQRLSLQYMVTRILAEAESDRAARDQVLQAIAQALDWDAAGFWEIDAQAGLIQAQHYWQSTAVPNDAFATATRGQTFRPSMGLPGRVWSTGQALWLGDLGPEADLPRLPYARSSGLRSGVAAPVRLGNQLLGVIEFFSLQSRDPDRDVIELLDGIGSQIGQFLERKRAEETVRFQRALLEAQSESSNEGILVVGQDGGVLSYNRRFADLWNIPDEVLQQRQDDQAIKAILYLLEDPDGFQERVRFLYAHPFEQGQDQIRLRDGRVFHRYTAPVLDAGGTHYGRVWYFRDVSQEREQLEIQTELNAALRETAVERDQALAELHALLDTRDAFLSSAAHDLRSPLAAIKMQAQLLERLIQRGELDLVRVNQAVVGITGSANRMAGIINDLLDTARIELGQPLDLSYRSSDPAALLKRVIAEQQRTTQRHSIELIESQTPVDGEWDVERLERVVTNLVDNAVKYSPGGGPVTVTLGTERVREGDWVVISVQDLGLGIPSAELPRIFDRFHRGSNVAERISGTGIGLAGARAIVEAHGGSISVQSEEGKGSTFTVHLPLHPVH
jgi:PAS domain S-box-containing protein